MNTPLFRRLSTSILAMALLLGCGFAGATPAVSILSQTTDDSGTDAEKPKPTRPLRLTQ